MLSLTRKAQSQVISAVIIGGILVGGISAAYVWGVPLLQKNRDVANIKETISTFNDLNDAIKAAKTRGSSGEIPISVGSGELRIDPDNGSITYTVSTNAAYVDLEGWTPINENDMRGVTEPGHGFQGDDEPGVLVGKAVELQKDRYQNTYKLAYRQMKESDSDRYHLIDLEQNGNLDASGGDHSIVVKPGDKETVDMGDKTLVNHTVLVRIE
ncbi:MAG: hypothetical protein MUP58_00080 [Candidatus Nanohaloarchaeota archaeon QJJ-9]|nr:hypothetical protein [Candidatus Nanohaloarchaeota archaeon QJJ-9]